MAYHHYISAFHLAEFSLKPVRQMRRSRIWVHDLAQAKSWPTSAAKAGGQGDYNAVQDVPGLDAQAVESLISVEIEGPASSTIRQVNTDLRLPDGDKWEFLLTYLALVQANNPARRATVNESQNQALKLMARMMLASPETIEAAQAEFRGDGVPLLGDLPAEHLQEMAARGFDHRAPATHHVRGLGQLVEAARAFLADRQWTLLVAPDGPLDFICGDHPVVGLPSMALEVLIPLGRRTCLLSRREALPPRIEANPAIIAKANRRQLDHAGRFVYSSSQTFEVAASQ